MAATDMKERKDIPPGTKISCTTFHDVTHEGEVLAFDYHTKLLVIKTKGVKRDLEVKVINLSQVKHFDISEEAKHSPSPLVTLDMQKIKKRHEETCREKQNEVETIGIGVTPEGQKVFNYIRKTLNCKWDRDRINVMNDVIITPPYKIENLQGTGNDKAVDHIRKIINKYYNEQVDGEKK